MQKPNKKTIKGMVLGAILMTGIFTLIPPNASADLTALDKIGTILTMLTNIQNIVTNIEGDVTNIEGNVTEINTDLLLKKRFYQFVSKDISGQPISFDPDNQFVNATIRVLSCAPELQAVNACAFNVESILIEVDESTCDSCDDGTPLRIIGPDVDGITSFYQAQLPKPNNNFEANFLVDASLLVESAPDIVIGPPGFVGASERVSVNITGPDQQEDIVITKIEFNGQQPQGIQLQLIVQVNDFDEP